MKNVKEISSFSRAVPKLQMRFNGLELAVGSGVVAKSGGSSFLITAAHNLTGRELDGNCKSAMGAVPNELILEGHFIKAALRLYGDDNSPDEETKLYALDIEQDIAIIKVDVSPQKGERVATPLHESFLSSTDHAVLSFGVAATCFLLGYPTGLQTNSPDGSLPIWKSATIASEPTYADPNQPLFIDTWGEPGLSGGPVLLAQDGRHRLIGIYTGRSFANPDPIREKALDLQNPPKLREQIKKMIAHNQQSLGRVTPSEEVIKLYEQNKDFLNATQTLLQA